MKNKIFVFAVVLFVPVFWGAYAEGGYDSGGSSSSGWGDTSVSSAPKIIRSKNIEVMDRVVTNQFVLIRVELREETGGGNAGQRYTFLTVTGLRVEGGRVESLSGSKLNEYQAAYGGRRSEYSYDDY
jgi:hypothetical protein